MARIARVICPGIPHHVTQRGNRRLQTFFCEEDYLAYIELMGEWCRRYDVVIWAWCLMPNHVHLIAVPQDETGLTRAIGEAHRRYTRRINFRENRRGHLWQERFASFPVHNLIPNWKALLHLSTEEELKILKRHEHTGRPLGRDSFVAKLEKTLGRVLRPQKNRPHKENTRLGILSPELP